MQLLYKTIAIVALITKFNKRLTIGARKENFGQKKEKMVKNIVSWVKNTISKEMDCGKMGNVKIKRGKYSPRNECISIKKTNKKNKEIKADVKNLEKNRFAK